MKTYILFFIVSLSLASVPVFAQTSARDWTKSDCDNTSHHLFDELDNNKIVVMDFVMPCGACVTATRYLDQIYKDYKTSHPGKVFVFATSDNNNQDCGYMNNWRMQNSFTMPTMTNGADDASYYVGAGMPTIVVVGGKDHKVYYKRQGFSSSQDAVIRKAIDDAILATSSVHGDPVLAGPEFSVYPNPSQNEITLSYTLVEAGTAAISIYNALGVEVRALIPSYQEEGFHTLSVSSLPAGVYTARMRGVRNDVVKFSIAR